MVVMERGQGRASLVRGIVQSPQLYMVFRVWGIGFLFPTFARDLEFEAFL